MSIKAHIDDAKFLISYSRYLSALTIILVAVAASAEKTFPQGEPSQRADQGQDNRCGTCGRGPSKAMGDNERFSLFLKKRIGKLLGFNSLTVEHNGRAYSLEGILYKFFRCKLVHEGALPGNVVFDTTSGLGNYLSISGGETIVLSAGLLGVLIEVVEGAKCNTHEFGRVYREFVPKWGEDEHKIVVSIAERHGLSEGRILRLVAITSDITCGVVESSNDVELCEVFNKLVEAGVIERRSALVTRGIVDDQYRLQPVGVAAIRDIASHFELVES